MGKRIKEFIKGRKEDGSFRQIKHLSSRVNVEIEIDGKKYIDFSSNNYLGLSNHPKIIEAAKNAIDKYGAGSLGSRLLSGSFDIHDELEAKTAEFKQKEAALVFNTGYQANVGIISTLAGKKDMALSDKLSHASIIDGIRLSGASHFRFKHNDMAHLEDVLKRERKRFRHVLIISESVFSMDGDLAPLKQLAGLKKKYDCLLFIDEAHATGVFGKTGAGLIEQERLSDKVDLIMGTFGKAMGSFGAYLACSRLMKNYLINACRSFIYSTALPPVVIAANIAAIDAVKKER
ncbi:MAG: 8-amino-7-oxononanoate synthase, partial [Candidatus Margulisiibacteriota bacterium]